MKILVLDNFDSFTYNLVHYFESLNCQVDVFRINEIKNVDALQYDKIVISPGPGLPQESEDLMSFIGKYYKQKPILGVCLGMQALAIFFQEQLVNLPQVKHGVAEKIEILSFDSLFRNIPNGIEVGLYHSWAVNLGENSQFSALAYSKNQVLMSFKHKKLPLYGVQFHPESILTQYGKEILQNFLNIEQ